MLRWSPGAFPAPAAEISLGCLCPPAVLFQKLPLTEYPLYLRLLAGPDTDVLTFVLKENETGEVEVGQRRFPMVFT